MEDSTFIFANEMMSAINSIGFYCSWRDRKNLLGAESFDLIITDIPHDANTATPILHSVTEKEFLIGLGTLNHFMQLQKR